MLEASQHVCSTFITLTYADECLPLTQDEKPELYPKHLQDWLKKLRKALSGKRVRYYLVGEYGDQTARPHYHVALFGFPGCERGETRYQEGDDVGADCCPSCALVARTWDMGRIHLGKLNLASCRYVASYVLKKMTNAHDARLEGRHPEFCRMSLRPGIGVDAMYDVASELLKHDLVRRHGDVPMALAHGGTQLPLGRYLRRKLRSFCGEEEDTPEEVVRQLEEDLREMYERAAESTSAPGMAQFRKYAFAYEVSRVDDQRVRNLEARRAIFKSEKKL